MSQLLALNVFIYVLRQEMAKPQEDSASFALFRLCVCVCVCE